MLMVKPALPGKIIKYCEPLAITIAPARGVGKHSGLGGGGTEAWQGSSVWQKSKSYGEVIKSGKAMAPGSYAYALYNNNRFL